MQEKIRDLLNSEIKTKGLKAKYVADKCNISETSLSRFRQNKRNLTKEKLQNLIQFLLS